MTAKKPARAGTAADDRTLKGFAKYKLGMSSEQAKWLQPMSRGARACGLSDVAYRAAHVR